MDYSILNNWTRLFPILGVFGAFFQFYSITNRNSCKHTVQTLIRRRVLRRLIWVCTDWLCPFCRTLSTVFWKLSDFEGTAQFFSDVLKITTVTAVVAPCVYSVLYIFWSNGAIIIIYHMMLLLFSCASNVMMPSVTTLCFLLNLSRR